MATKFGDKKIKREIRLYVVESPINVTMTAEGVSMAVAGSSKHVSASWEKLVRHMDIPGNAPSIFDGKPLEFLKDTARKIKVRKERRDKEVA